MDFKKTGLLVLLAAATAGATKSKPPAELYSPLISQKLSKIATSQPNPPRYPQYTDRVGGVWRYFDPGGTWTTGFFPATLYAMHERSQLCPSSSAVGDVDWLNLGRQWSTGILPYTVNNGLEHDVGFVSYPFQYEMAVNPKNQTAINAINDFARGLAARYNSVVGCTRSWNTADPTDFQVIIDNMMNLQLFFVSATLTGNNTFREMAISHADRTLRDHLRPDGSSFHVVHYNSTTGAVTRKRTAQGYADSSTWSRGQAWGLYGFATMYENTRMTRYLEAARRMATYYHDNLPADGIVPWDFNAPLSPPRPADSSGANVAATGLLLLSRLEMSLTPPNKAAAKRWSDLAIRIVDKMTDLAWRPSWESLLANGTVNNPANPPNNLTGIVYGDYYFIKTGNDLINMGLANCPSV